MPVPTDQETLYQVLDQMVAALQADEAFKQRIAHANVSVGLTVSDLGGEYTLAFRQGEVSGQAGASSGATIGVTLSMATLDKLFSGLLDGESAYMSGQLRLRGDEWTAQSAAYYISFITPAYKAARG